MKKNTIGKSVRLTAFFYIVAVAGILAVVNACNKSKHTPETTSISAPVAEVSAGAPFVQGTPQTKVVTILDMSPIPGTISTRVIFRELAESFNIVDKSVIASLKAAYNENKAVKITFDPWRAIVTEVKPASAQERSANSSHEIASTPGYSLMGDIDKIGTEVINTAGIAAINTTTPGLTSVIPDMATAQLMFDYIAHQCCALPGPYGIDHCISFQYCEDGCYARAHKMCWIINNKYNYDTHKVFSFAYPSTYTLSVKAEKWGGCCINWWYHVAPLVNIKTPSGTKAYVFDPAMFDQPVLLATWLHAQQNPACASGNAKVTSFNIQPTSSYSPADTAHFDTDPMYSSTNSTLIGYAPLKTCP